MVIVVFHFIVAGRVNVVDVVFVVIVKHFTASFQRLDVVVVVAVFVVVDVVVVVIVVVVVDVVVVFDVVVVVDAVVVADVVALLFVQQALPFEGGEVLLPVMVVFCAALAGMVEA